MSRRFTALVTVREPCKPLNTVGVHVAMSLRTSAHVMMVPVAPVSKMASEVRCWLMLRFAENRSEDRGLRLPPEWWCNTRYSACRHIHPR